MNPKLDESPSRFHAAIVDGVRAEEATRAMPLSEVPVSSLLETVPALMWASMPDGSPSYLNHRCVEYTGRSLSDFLRLGWLDLIHPEDREETLRTWLHAMQSGSSYRAKHRIRRADGEYRWFLACGEPMRDHEGRVIQFFGLSMDIDESVKREAEIRRLFDANIVGIVFWDLDGGIRGANDAFLSIVGYERADLASGRLRWTDLTPPEWRTRDRESVEQQARLTGSVQPYEKEFFRKDGSRVPVLIGGAAFDEAIKHGVAFVVEITERKRAELALGKSEDRYALAMEASGDGHADWNIETGELYVSPRYLEICGLPRDTTFRDRAEWVEAFPFHPEDRAKWETAVAAHFASPGTRFREEMRIVVRGETRWLEVTYVCRRDAAGRPIRWTSSCHDITERKRAEEELRRSQHYLAEAQKVSHTGSWAWSPVSNTILYWSEECYRILGYDPAQGPPSFESSFERIHPEDRPMLGETIERAVREKAEFQIEYRLVLPDGTRRNVRILSHPVLDASGKLVEFVGTVMDVTEQKRASQERRAHLWFLESMDRINRAMQRSNDVELMTSGVMQEALEIFACDRACMTYPCDPDTPTYRTVMEHTSPEYGGALTLGQDRPMTPEWAEVTRRALHHPEAVVDPSLPPGRREQYRIASLLAIAVRPKGAQPYLFVVHSARSRPWTAAELRLFEETARRLGDAMTSVLAHRNLLAREKELRRSQHYLAEAQRLSHIGSWAFNADGFGYWSPELFKIHGLDPGSKAPSIPEYLALVHPEDRNFVVQEIEKLLAGAEGFDFTKRIMRPDGAIRHVRCVGIRAATGGNVQEFVGSGMDVTEQERAEEERRAHLWFLESMDRINRAMQRTNDVEGMTSGVLEETLAIFGSDRAWLVYPCDPDAATSRVVMEHTRPEYPGAFALGEEFPVDTQAAEALRRVLDGPGAVTDLSVPPKIRERFSIQSILAIAVRPKGDRPYLFGLHQCSHGRAWTAAERRLFEEIARRLEDALTSVLAHRNLLASEEELRTSEQRFRTFVDHATDAFYLYDDENVVRDVNRQACETTGYTREELIGMHVSQLSASATPEAIKSMWQQLVEHGTLTYNGLRRRKDGSVFPVEIRARTFNRGGRVFALAVAIDITERRRREQRLLTQFRVTQTLSEASSLEKAAPGILCAMCEALEWDLGALWQVDPEGGVLRCIATWPSASAAPADFAAATQAITFGPGMGLPGRVWSSGGPVWIRDVALDAELPRAKSAAKEGLHAAFAFPVTLKSGIVGVIELFSREVRNADHGLLQMMAAIGSQVAQFVERTRATDALRASEARFRGLTELSSDWYWEQDENLRFAYTSRQPGETSSYPSEWVIGKTRWELPGITPLSFTWPEHQAVLAARQPFRDLEYARAGLDGVHYVSISGAPIFDEEGVFRGYQGIGRDITERRRVQEALRTSEDRYARAMEGSDAGHWDWNLVTQEMFVSKRAREMLALPDGPLPARRDEIMALVPLHPDDRTLMPEEIQASIESGSLVREYRVIPRPDEMRWLRSRGKVFRDAQGVAVRMTGSLLDITGSKVAADALRDAREKLAQASRIASLAELSASIAHEINQPLQAIVANGHAGLRWLDATPPNIEKAIRTAKRIVRDGNAAADVVSRIRALFNHAAPAKVDLDINKLILQVRTLMADEIQGNGASLETELGEDVPGIRADAVQIQQVIVNLVRNAIEAMAATMERPKPLWIRSRREVDKVVVEVQDRGAGLADSEKIFEPFVTTKETGMGMGLAICRSIIEAHAGHIWFVRNEDRGVTFSFSLPIATEDAT